MSFWWYLIGSLGVFAVGYIVGARDACRTAKRVLDERFAELRKGNRHG